MLWAVLLRITGMRHPMVIEYPGIGRAREWLAAFALLMLVLTFSPTPLAHNSVGELLVPLRSWLLERFRHGAT